MKHSKPKVATLSQCCHQETTYGLLETGLEPGCLKTFNWKLVRMKEVPIFRAYQMDVGTGIKSRDSLGELAHYCAEHLFR